MGGDAVSGFDGNAEQTRLIIGQAVEAMMIKKGGFSEEIAALKSDIERDLQVQVDATVTKMKFWVVSAVLTQLVAMLPVIFFLGGIYSTNADALETIKKTQAVLEQRGAWMNERERWEQSMEQWAGPKGFQPPRYRNTSP